MSEQIEAPWESDQVKSLNDWQIHGDMPAFTCIKRDDGEHRHIGRDTGMLIATKNGWICPFCDYSQNWAHEFMTTFERKKTKYYQTS